jgi:acyl carrier protein
MDDMAAAFARTLESIAEVKRANVTRDKRLREELGLDSLSLIDVAVATEDAFGIRIPDEELEHFQTVGDAIDYIQRAMVAAGKEVPRFVAAP